MQNHKILDFRTTIKMITFLNSFGCYYCLEWSTMNFYAYKYVIFQKYHKYMKITLAKPLAKNIFARLRMSPSKKKKGNLLCMWFGGVAVSWQPFFHDLHTKLYLTLLVCSVLTRTVRLLREHFGIMEMKLEFFTGIWNRQIAFIFRTKPAVEIFMIFFFHYY